MAESEQKDKIPPKNRVIHQALAIFKERNEFDRFLAKHDFIKNLSALSYLEPVEDNQGHYVSHLYFYGHGNRITTMENTFSFGEFKNDPDLKRNYFDETNELSRYIRDYKQQNNITEEIKRVLKPKRLPIPVPQMQMGPQQTEMAESHVEESLKNRLDSLSEEDVKQGLGVKSKHRKKQNENPQLSDVCEGQRQEILQLRQDRQQMRILLQGLLHLLPQNETQTVKEQLKNMDNFYQPLHETISPFNGMDDFMENDKPNKTDSISNFFAKENDHANQGLLGTSPVLVSNSGAVGGHPSAIDSVMEEEKEEILAVEVQVDKERETAAEHIQHQEHPEEQAIVVNNHNLKEMEMDKDASSPSLFHEEQAHNTNKTPQIIRTLQDLQKYPWRNIKKGVLNIWQAIKFDLQRGNTEEEIRQNRNTTSSWKPIIDLKYDHRTYS